MFEFKNQNIYYIKTITINSKYLIINAILYLYSSHNDILMASRSEKHIFLM